MTGNFGGLHTDTWVVRPAQEPGTKPVLAWLVLILPTVVIGSGIAVSLAVDPLTGAAFRWFAAALATVTAAWLLHTVVPAPALLLAAAAALSNIAGLPDRVPVANALLAFAVAALCYRIGRRMESIRLASVMFSVLIVLSVPVAMLVTGQPQTWVALLVTVAGSVVMPWGLGRWARERAGQRERERAMSAERERSEERTRIAHDMHDSLGHHLSLAALQAGALEMAPGLSDAHRVSAGELRAAIAAAAERLEEIIGILDTGSDPSPTHPVDESIDDLVARARAAGMNVRLHTHGPPATLPPLIDRAAHRVVQEALTNAAKHAPGDAVRLSFAYSAEEVVITVRNNGTPETAASPRAASSGRGLIGLHERVRLAGGSFRAGADQHSEFSVEARLPLQSDSRVPGRSTASVSPRHSI